MEAIAEDTTNTCAYPLSKYILKIIFYEIVIREETVGVFSMSCGPVIWE